MAVDHDRLLAGSPAGRAADPGLHQGFSLIQGQASPLRPLAQRLSTVTGRLQQGQQLTAGHSAECDSRRTLLDPEMSEGCGIGSPGELEGPRRSDRNHLAPELDGSTRSPRTDITTHRTAIKLPKGQKPMTPESGVALPELTAEVVRGETVTLQTAAHRQAPQGNPGRGETREQNGEGVSPAWCCVHLHGIRADLLQQIHHRFEADPMVMLLDQPQRTGRQTTAAAVATPGRDAPGA